MSHDRYPKLALEGYVQGRRVRGRPKKRWLDVVRSDCADLGLTIHDAIYLAQDRDAWRRSTLCPKKRTFYFSNNSLKN